MEINGLLGKIAVIEGIEINFLKENIRVTEGAERVYFDIFDESERRFLRKWYDAQTGKPLGFTYILGKDVPERV